MSETYIILLQPSQQVLNDKKRLKNLEEEIPDILKCCFRNAEIKNVDEFRSILNLPVNEEYKEIYSVTLKKKMSQEQRCFFEQSFSQYNSRKILRKDDIVKS